VLSTFTVADATGGAMTVTYTGDDTDSVEILVFEDLGNGEDGAFVMKADDVASTATLTPGAGNYAVYGRKVLATGNNNLGPLFGTRRTVTVT
jgi:hypothetical protein